MIARWFYIFFILVQSLDARALQELCIRAISGYGTKVYSEDLSLISKEIKLKNGNILKVDSYIASGRPSVVGVLKKKSMDGHPLVIKKVRDPKYEKDLRQEWSFYEKNSGEFQQRVVPILERAETDAGTTLLLKPFIDGDSLSSLITNKTLNNIQLSSLQGLVAWTEDYHRRTGVALDINPLNLVWVEDTASMRAVGISEPSFIFYELTPRGSKLDTFLYKNLLSRIRSYKEPHDIAVEDFPEPVLDGEEVFN